MRDGGHPAEATNRAQGGRAGVCAAGCELRPRGRVGQSQGLVPDATGGVSPIPGVAARTYVMASSRLLPILRVRRDGFQVGTSNANTPREDLDPTEPSR